VPEDPDSGSYYIEDYEEIEDEHIKFLLKNFYGTFKRDYLRNILVINQKGLSYLSKKHIYNLEFVPKAEFISGKQARKNQRLKDAQKLKNAVLQERKAAKFMIERTREEILKSYPILIEGGHVRYNVQKFGNRSGTQQKFTIREITWKIDVWYNIVRLQKNEKFWYYCRDIDTETYIKEQLGL